MMLPETMDDPSSMLDVTIFISESVNCHYHKKHSWMGDTDIALKVPSPFPANALSSVSAP